MWKGQQQGEGREVEGEIRGREGKGETVRYGLVCRARQRGEKRERERRQRT